MALLLAGQYATAQRPLGIDVSSYQSNNVNWSSVKSAGYVFAWAKAVEGTTITDADFVINENGAKSVGIYMGAYDFSHPASNTPGAESSHFWSVAGAYIRADGLTLTPMLDYETFTGYTGASSYADWANQWCQDVQAYASNNGVYIRPEIYISACNTSVLNTSDDVWICHIADYNGKSAQTDNPWDTTACTPNEIWGSGVWNFWQYSSSGSVSGVSGNCDVDVYNGTLSSLIATAVGVSTAPTISSLTTNITVWQGSNATFSVTASNVTSYQWVFNHTNIAGANSSSYTVSRAQISNAGPYYVTLSNAHASSTSPTVFLSVLGALTNSPGAAFAPTNMADWWPADGNAADIYGTLNGTPAGGFSYVTGHNGLAFHFDGSSSYISTGGADLAPPWTATMWVNYSHTSQSSAGLLEDGVYSLKLEQKGSGTHNVGISQAGYQDSTFNYAAPTNTWVHLAFVGTSSNVTLYANGTNEGSIATNTMPLPRAYIGGGYLTASNSYVDFMLGSLDDVMVFSRALSSTEISRIYSAGSSSLVRAPYIVGGQVTANSHFNLTMEGLTGKNFTIFVATNLQSPSWVNLGLLTNATGTNTYVVPNVHKYQQIYFSVSQPY